MVREIIKRDGRVVRYDFSKIEKAIYTAMSENKSDVDRAHEVALAVDAIVQEKYDGEMPSVEQIQDLVEQTLMEKGFTETAKAYILYRQKRQNLRNINDTLMNYKDTVEKYLKLGDWRVKENSTVTYSVGGLILSNSGAITAN